MGLDIGMTGCKALVISPPGEVLALERETYPTLRRWPGWFELDAALVWGKARETMRRAARAAREAGDPVAALAPSVLGEALVPLDGRGEPLSFSPVATDARGAADIRAFETRVGGEEIFRITGHSAHPMFALAKLLHWQRAEEALFRGARRFACWEDFVIGRLTGRFVIDPSLAARTLLFDIHSRTWSSRLLAESAVPPQALSEVAPSGRPVGAVESGAARREDLPDLEGCLVVTGGWDQACAALGTGVVEEGQALDNTGTTECIAAPVRTVTRRKRLREGHYQLIPHVAGTLFLVCGGTLAAGTLLDWYRQVSGGEAPDLEARIDRLPPEPSGLLILPYFAGAGTPRFEEGARGLIWGLTLETTGRDLLQGLIEGLGYQLRWNIEYLRDCGIRVDTLHVSGGASRSAWWVRQKSNLTGCPCVVPRLPEASALGAALLAGLGSGKIAGLDAALELTARGARRIAPDPVLQARYEPLYRSYRQVEAAFAAMRRP